MASENFELGTSYWYCWTLRRDGSNGLGLLFKLIFTGVSVMQLPLVWTADQLLVVRVSSSHGHLPFLNNINCFQFEQHQLLAMMFIFPLMAIQAKSCAFYVFFFISLHFCFSTCSLAWLLSDLQVQQCCSRPHRALERWSSLLPCCLKGWRKCVLLMNAYKSILVVGTSCTSSSSKIKLRGCFCF